jgi:hypothetical protein
MPSSLVTAQCPQLADVYMITGLDVSGSVYPWDYKGSTRQTGVKPGSGYKLYIRKHMKDGPWVTLSIEHS